MSSKIETCNMALSHLGIEEEIQNFDTEKSSAARACRRFWDIAWDTTLRGFDWPVATKFATLSLVEDLTEEDEDSEWVYSYRLPIDCANFRRLIGITRVEVRETRIPYRVTHDADGGLLYTDQEDAKCEYTGKMTDLIHLCPPDMILAQSYYLAALVAPRLTGGDPFKKGPAAEVKYFETIGKARETAVNEEQADVPLDSEFIRAREG